MTKYIDASWIADPRQEISFRKNDLEARAMFLLNLIAAEFKSDPMSVQCFDLRLVNEITEMSNELLTLPDYDERYDGPPLKARTAGLGNFGYGTKKTKNRYDSIN